MSNNGPVIDNTTLFTNPTAEPEVSQRTLESYLMRTAVFLTTVRKDDQIRGLLEARGYDNAEHEDALKRVTTLLGLGPSKQREVDQLRAMNEVDAADENIFKIVTATLTRRFPEDAEEILRGIAPGAGYDAVLNLEILLDRIDERESGVGREATREGDMKIVNTLAKRGFDKEERDRLKALITLAKQVTPVMPTAALQAKEEKRYIENLMAVRDWYLEWADIARTVMKRRDQLIKLGLASLRRPGKEEEPAPPPIPAPTPAPTPTPAPAPPEPEPMD